MEDAEYPEPDETGEDYKLERLLTGNPVMRDDNGAPTGTSMAPGNTFTVFRPETSEGVLRAVGQMKYRVGNDEGGGWTVGLSASLYEIRRSLGFFRYPVGYTVRL